MHDLRQEESSVADYFPVLIRQWQKIDLIDEFQWTCNKDEKLYRSIVENKRVFKFLMGLNRDLDDVRGRVLSTKPLPSLRAAFSEVRQEESRRTVMLALRSRVPQPLMALPSLHSAMPHLSHLIRRLLLHGMDRVQLPRKEDQFQDDLWCKKCKKPNHNIDSCWKIHGKPADWKPERERRANVTVSVDDHSSAESIAPNWRHFKGYSASKPGCHQTMTLDQEVRLSSVIIP